MPQCFKVGSCMSSNAVSPDERTIASDILTQGPDRNIKAEKYFQFLETGEASLEVIPDSAEGPSTTFEKFRDCRLLGSCEAKDWVKPQRDFRFENRKTKNREEAVEKKRKWQYLQEKRNDLFFFMRYVLKAVLADPKSKTDAGKLRETDILAIITRREELHPKPRDWRDGGREIHGHILIIAENKTRAQVVATYVNTEVKHANALWAEITIVVYWDKDAGCSKLAEDQVHEVHSSGDVAVEMAHICERPDTACRHYRLQRGHRLLLTPDLEKISTEGAASVYEHPTKALAKRELSFIGVDTSAGGGKQKYLVTCPTPYLHAKKHKMVFLGNCGIDDGKSKPTNAVVVGRSDVTHTLTLGSSWSQAPRLDEPHFDLMATPLLAPDECIYSDILDPQDKTQDCNCIYTASMSEVDALIGFVQTLERRIAPSVELPTPQTAVIRRWVIRGILEDTEAVLYPFLDGKCHDRLDRYPAWRKLYAVTANPSHGCKMAFKHESDYGALVFARIAAGHAMALATALLVREHMGDDALLALGIISKQFVVEPANEIARTRGPYGRLGPTQICFLTPAHEALQAMKNIHGLDLHVFCGGS